MDEKYNLNFDSLKMEILNSISKQVGEGAKVHAENIEDEKFRDEIKNIAGKWGESVYDAAQVAVLVPTGLFAFDQFLVCRHGHFNVGHWKPQILFVSWQPHMDAKRL